jgi:hypothetical protein
MRLNRRRIRWERGRGEEAMRTVAGGEIGRGVAGFSSAERVELSRGDRRKLG